MDHDQRNCPRCGKDAGDFHFCPSCLAPVDSMNAIATREVLRAESMVLAADGTAEDIGGNSSTAVQVEAERPLEQDSTPRQVHMGARPSVPPPAPLQVARMEDVLSVEPKADRSQPVASALELPIRVDPRVSIAPPAQPRVARLEDVLTVDTKELVVEIAPKTAAAESAVVETTAATPPAEAIADAAPAAVAPAPVEEVQPPATSKPAASPKAYVPAYALRAAFWFEQASAFESSSDADDEIDEPVPAATVPEVDTAQLIADLSTPQVELEASATDLQPKPRRNGWVFALALLGLAGLVAVLTGRRGCRCSCKAGS
jgi:hypothetical protein